MKLFLLLSNNSLMYNVLETAALNFRARSDIDCTFDLLLSVIKHIYWKVARGIDCHIK